MKMSRHTAEQALIGGADFHADFRAAAAFRPCARNEQSKHSVLPQKLEYSICDCV